MKFVLSLVLAIFLVYASGLKRQRESEDADNESSKRLKVELAPLGTTELPSEIWSHVCGHLDTQDLCQISLVNEQLRAVSIQTAVNFLFGEPYVVAKHFRLLLPLGLHYLRYEQLPVEKAAQLYATLFSFSVAKETTLLIMKQWRAFYDSANNEILYNSLVEKIYKNEIIFKYLMIKGETLLFMNHRYGFFYPMGLIYSSCHSARIIWNTFIAELPRLEFTDLKKTGYMFFRDVFPTLDADVQGKTLESIAINYVFAEKPSTKNAHMIQSDSISALEAKIGTSPPNLTVDQLWNKLESASPEEFEEIMAALHHPLSIFQGNSYYRTNKAIMEYRQRAYKLGMHLLSGSSADISKYTKLSPILWQQIAAFIESFSIDRISGQLWKADSFEKMSIFYFCCTHANKSSVIRALANFFDANKETPIVGFFTKAHWKFIISFDDHTVISVVQERLEKELLGYIDSETEDLTLINNYNEAIKIPEFKQFLQRIIPRSVSFGHSFAIEGLVGVFPEYEAFFHDIFWSI